MSRRGVGWSNLRESTLGLLLTGRCDRWVGKGRNEAPEFREEQRRGDR